MVNISRQKPVHGHLPLRNFRLIYTVACCNGCAYNFKISKYFKNSATKGTEIEEPLSLLFRLLNNVKFVLGRVQYHVQRQHHE